MIPRENLTHWDALVYVEMFLAGVAAGAYMTAAILELVGRGRSSVARTAHLIAFPLMLVCGLLLTVDLGRPERFWHMIVQSKTSLPMFKLWSPMSMGSWLVLVFPAFAFVSFLDALIAGRLFRIGGWRAESTLHGSPAGRIWAVIGGLLAFAVGSYSGILLSATNFPGWGDSAVLGALFVVTAVATGLGALLLGEAIRGQTSHPDIGDLARASVMVILWQLILIVVFVATLGPAGVRVFLAGSALVAIVGAALLGGLLPLLLLRFGAAAARPSMAALAGVLVLVGGFLLRYAVVIGPQQHG
ncbi:MAG TPA: NrfD/PsrC family molybdoenzyme membrane anchor subunit [Chloroflexota bacterium]|nr:NrfD/PsrC family molybdoenzyme membrane anchor subunit [Chloroflexota bacterium]